MWNILNWLKKENRSYFEQKVTRFIGDELDFYYNRRPSKDKFKKTFFSRGRPGLLELIFQRFMLKGAKKSDPHTDILRAIKVSDSKPLDKDALMLEEVKVLSATNEDYTLSRPTYLEVIPKDKELTFTLTIDEDILGDFVKENCDNNRTLISFKKIEGILRDPIQTVETFTQKLLREEKTYFGKIGLSSFLSTIEIKNPNLRLGWGSGLLGTTLATLLDEPLLQDLRNLLFTDRGGAIAPKTRRVTIENRKPIQPLGWVKVK